MDILYGFIAGFIIFSLFDVITFRVKFLKERIWDHPKTFFGYHLHHSLYGFILMLVGLIRYPFFIGFGFGMILAHTITDRRLVFIEKIT